MIGARSALLAATNSDIIWSDYLVAASGMTGTSGGSFLIGNSKAVFDEDPYNVVLGARGTTLLFTPPTPIPFSTGLWVIGMEPGWDEVLLNGVTSLTADSNGVATFNGPGSLVTLRGYDRDSQFEFSMLRIYVDGYALIDGVPPISTSNPLAPLVGQWSTNLVAALGGGTSGGSFWSLYPNPASGFDNSLNTAVGSAIGSTLLFTPSSPISFSSSLKIYGLEAGYDSAVLNGTTTVVADTQGIITFAGPGSLVTLRIQDRPSSYYNASFTYITVDGRMLVDT